MSVDALDTSTTTDVVRPSTRWILAAVGALGLVVVVMAMSGFSDKPLATLDRLETMGRACVSLSDSAGLDHGQLCIEENEGRYMFDGTGLGPSTEVVVTADTGDTRLTMNQTSELTMFSEAGPDLDAPLKITRATWNGGEVEITVAYSDHVAPGEDA